MYVLGIETSCDETSIAVTSDNKILANSVSSSVHLHRDFGGVIPEIASRYHVEYINHVLKKALTGSGIGLNKIDLIAVTTRPGLMGSLLVGAAMAEALSLAGNIPLMSIDHIHAHLYAGFMKNGASIKSKAGRGKPDLRFPFVGLVVSGGHTSLFTVNGVDDYKLLGRTFDDAAGEAFDKVAKLLNLGYPGGPEIEKRASGCKVNKKIFPGRSSSEDLNFSFSGLKTSVLYYVRNRLRDKHILSGDKNKPDQIARLTNNLGHKEINDIAASFQEAVTEILTEKAIAACQREGMRRLALGGGVSANTQLRKKLSARTVQNGIRLYLPQKRLCLDNAAMVAGLGAALYKKGRRCGL
ncbi:MAG: tRNA (adenosine(37)-N6)-threonylcarbamoyltransferase complex transferase subunit TsaD [Candidatus Omnitrophica bacterium]|nr:tRNA (adenosine(37)-N6)-threonylcarbamoyltransferase complex transferase subunit TsaD [Candidatus Omnitrophota bacterium]